MASSEGNSKRTAASLAAVLLLAGCAVGPDFVVPSPPDATGYTPEPLGRATASAATSGGGAQRFDRGRDLPGQWWTLFHSRELNALVEKALVANPDLQAAQAALRVARENVHAQRGALLPAVDGSFGGIRQQPAIAAPSDVGSDAPTFNLFTGQLNISYSPDVFGGTRRSIEALAAQAESQRFALEATYLTLTSNLAGAAVQEAALRGQIAATLSIIKIETDVLALCMNREPERGAVGGHRRRRRGNAEEKAGGAHEKIATGAMFGATLEASMPPVRALSAGAPRPRVAPRWAAAAACVPGRPPGARWGPPPTSRFRQQRAARRSPSTNCSRTSGVIGRRRNIGAR